MVLNYVEKRVKCAGNLLEVNRHPTVQKPSARDKKLGFSFKKDRKRLRDSPWE